MFITVPGPSNLSLADFSSAVDGIGVHYVITM